MCMELVSGEIRSSKMENLELLVYGGMKKVAVGFALSTSNGFFP